MSPNNLVKCLACGKTLIREEFESHSCLPKNKGVRYVNVSQWWESRTEEGKPLLVALGLDGFVYRLTKVVTRAFIEVEPDESFQVEKNLHSDDDFPETNADLIRRVSARRL
jgi:hypothetical protein